MEFSMLSSIHRTILVTTFSLWYSPLFYFLVWHTVSVLPKFCQIVATNIKTPVKFFLFYKWCSFTLINFCYGAEAQGFRTPPVYTPSSKHPVTSILQNMHLSKLTRAPCNIPLLCMQGWPKVNLVSCGKMHKIVFPSWRLNNIPSVYALHLYSF